MPVTAANPKGVTSSLRPEAEMTAIEVIQPGAGLQAAVSVVEGRPALSFVDGRGRELARLVFNEEGPGLGWRDAEGKELRGYFWASGKQRADGKMTAGALLATYLS